MPHHIMIEEQPCVNCTCNKAIPPDYANLELYFIEEPEYTRRERYVMWASLHTLNPFAWPWVIYMSILIYRDKRAHKDD